MKLKNIIPVMVVLLLGSCAKQELDSPNGVPAGAVRINYSLPVATVVETRANADKEVAEKSVTSMHVLVFGQKGNVPDALIEIKKAEVTLDGTLVKLSSSDGAQRAVFVFANIEAIIAAAGDIFDPATATWTTIRGALMLGSMPTTPQAADLPTTPLPMFPKSAVVLSEIVPGVTEIGTAAAPVKLLSGYAKVSLTSTGTPLTVTGIALHNAPRVGGRLFAEVVPEINERVNYHDAGFTQAVNYIYPNSTATHAVDLIVKGRYAGDSEDTFYRIALSKRNADGSREKFDFEANHHYAVKLTQVGTHGYPTIEEAIENIYSNVITDIEIGDMTGEVVTNGQYYMSLTNQSYEVVAGSAPVTITTLRTDAPTITNRSAMVVSSIGDGADFITGVSLNETTGVITATTKDIAGGAIVRVTVGNLSQDITITNTDKPITLVDTDEQAFLTATSVGDIVCTMTGTLSDKLGAAVDAPTKKVTISRENVLHDGKKYSGKITVADAKANVSYWVPVALEMYTVNVGGTLTTSTDGVRKFWKGGINWATGNISMPNVSSGHGMVISTNPNDNGMHFKWMTEWGGYGGMPPFSDNSLRTDVSVNFFKWADIAVGGSVAPNYLKYDPCFNVAMIPGIPGASGKDWRSKYWRIPKRAECEALAKLPSILESENNKYAKRFFINGRLQLYTSQWLKNHLLPPDGDGGADKIDSHLSGLWLDSDGATIYRPGDNNFITTVLTPPLNQAVDIGFGSPVRCVKDNTRTN